MTTGPFKVMTTAEGKKILQDLHKKQGLVLFKFPDTGVHRMKVEIKGWGQNILGSRPATIGESRKDQIVTGSFTLNDDLYFFQAKVRLQKRLLHLEILPGGLSLLARRGARRVRVPASLEVDLVTKRIGDRLVFLRGPVQDISLRGFRVGFLGTVVSIKSGDAMTGTLRYGHRKPLVVSATVRHHSQKSTGRFGNVVGFEFTKFEEPARFQNWLVDLYREIYSRRKT